MFTHAYYNYSVNFSDFSSFGYNWFITVYELLVVISLIFLIVVQTITNRYKMFNSVDQFTSKPLWHNGPSPGSFYNFPNTHVPNNDFITRSQTPITTGTSIVALKFNDGVIIAGDMLGSYGSLARFKNIPRVLKVNDKIILGAGGDYADFQYLKDIIDQKIIDEECLDDGFSLKPKSLYCWLTRVMYNRRSKFDPFWNNFVVGGIQDDVPFLGTVDKLGTAYEDNAICTGYGAHMALPLIRDFLEKNPVPTEEQAKEMVHKSLEILYYRDARSSPKYQYAILNSKGVEIFGPIDTKQNWGLAMLIKGYN